MGRCNCTTCSYHKDGKCSQGENMTDEEYEDYFIYGISCPYHNKRPVDIIDVICEYMSKTFGGPCHAPDTSSALSCKFDCHYDIQGYEACWKRTFKKLKEKKDGQDNTR